ncbi:MAG: hypothetical protein JL50_09175 [Peptococcaceae bacterium BICA1-7]|nr:MAG: hypothetical protein JL50_09175 [Peptococcaceae bacterium BICA1-7]HBV97233.1 hypothetical protein [Desulfotomaculum sp.]
MADLTIHIEPSVDREAIDRVKNTLSQVNRDDQITIVMEAADAHQADRLMEILRSEGFDYQPRGSHDGRQYLVTARRSRA